MKLAIITSQYPNIGDPYNHMFVHMRSVEFVKNGVDLTVYIPSNIYKEYIYEGIRVIKSPSKQIIKQLRLFDLVYLHLLNIFPFTKKDGWVIYKYILFKAIPFAMYIHGNEVQKYTRRFYNFDFTIKQFLIWFKKDIIVIPRIKRFIKATKDKQNTSFIFPSKWMKNEAELNINFEFNKYHIIPNGIDIHLFYKLNVKENKYKILSLRPLSDKVYDIKQSIDVLKILPEPFTLDIYGKGKFLNEYKNYIKKLKLENRVKIFPKFVERNEMNAFFSNYGIFISTTKTDSQGVTMLEAMSSGLLTVSNNNTSKQEFILDGKTGILGETTQEIADKIVKVVSNKDLFNKITSTGRNSMLRIDISKTVQKEIEVLDMISKI